MTMIASASRTWQSPPPTPSQLAPGQQAENSPYDANLPSEIPSTIGMIYPQEASLLYAGRTAFFGFRDPGQYNISIPGVFRIVTPILTYANRTNVILEPWGHLDLEPPLSSYYPPVLDKGWCGFQVSPEDRTHSRPFKIPEGLAGSELRFVLNVTYSVPTYTGPDHWTNCSPPAVLYRSYFASYLLPIAPRPSIGAPTPGSLAVNATVFLPLSTAIPLPGPKFVDHTQDAAKRNYTILGVVLGLGVLAVMGTVVWLVKRRRRLGLADLRWETRERELSGLPRDAY